MLYSSGALVFFREVQAKIKSTGTSSVVNTRKIETSEPTELDEAFLLSELRYDGSAKAESQQLGGEGSATPGSGARTPLGTAEEKKFAKPRGPARRKA
jgi:twinfilin